MGNHLNRKKHDLNESLNTNMVTNRNNLNDKKNVGFLSIQELYNTQADLRSFYLLIDSRTSEEYSLSHIDLSVQLTEMKLPENFRPNISCDLIIYGNTIGQCQYSTKLIESYFQQNNYPFKQFLLLNDSFEEYSKRYPYLCSNSFDYIEGRLFPSQIDEHVFLSNFGVASNPDILRLLGITHILNCTVDCPFADTTELENEMSLPSQYQRLRVPVIDERDQQISNYFYQAINFIEIALQENNETNRINRVIIHCKHGQSRSATVAAAWLIKCKGYTTNDSLNYLKKCRSKVSPNEGFIQQLKLFEESLNK